MTKTTTAILLSLFLATTAGAQDRPMPCTANCTPTPGPQGPPGPAGPRGQAGPAPGGSAHYALFMGAAALRQTTWQPIATAPKDGNRVLLYVPDEAGSSYTTRC